ncbi:MAG: hypothetical protein LBJ72_12570 [Dysgonamonadaceae bacterium]|jgi:hypothetical protein|nr:hypothetical protein [Dysgonamonadaceae bacterium]
MFKATQEQIADWKAKHGDVFRIQVEDKSCYLKKPSRKALGYASMAGKENPLKFNEVLLNDCWLAGDEDVKTDDTLFLSVSSKLTELIQVKDAELEKL